MKITVENDKKYAVLNKKEEEIYLALESVGYILDFDGETVEELEKSIKEQITNIITAALRELLTGKKVLVVVGCGSMGSYFAEIKLRELVMDRDNSPDIVVFLDGDTVEQKNLVKSVYLPTDVGKNKARVLAERFSPLVKTIALERDFLGIDDFILNLDRKYLTLMSIVLTADKGKSWEFMRELLSTRGDCSVIVLQSDKDIITVALNMMEEGIPWNPTRTYRDGHTIHETILALELFEEIIRGKAGNKTIWSGRYLKAFKTINEPIIASKRAIEEAIESLRMCRY